MREIKFRAWDGKNIHYWGFIEANKYSGPPSSHRANAFQMTHMQFTGLKDKNGKDVFEGDIIRVPHDVRGEIVVGEVCFERGTFVLRGADGGFFRFMRDGLGQEWHSLEIFYPNDIEVLGNIYENPVIR